MPEAVKQWVTWREWIAIDRSVFSTTRRKRHQTEVVDTRFRIKKGRMVSVHLGEDGMNLHQWGVLSAQRPSLAQQSPQLQRVESWQRFGIITHLSCSSGTCLSALVEAEYKLTGSFVQSGLVCLCSSVTLYHYQDEAVSNYRACCAWRSKANLHWKRYQSHTLCQDPPDKTYPDEFAEKSLSSRWSK